MAEVTLPQLGETVTEGTITRWFKKVGDTVALDEPLFEVSTDKVDTEVPSPIAGVLTEIRVPEGETVPVGAVIGVVGDAGASAGGVFVADGAGPDNGRWTVGAIVQAARGASTEAAFECLRTAIALRPDYAEAYSNRGNALRDLKRYEEAVNWYHSVPGGPERDESRLRAANAQALAGRLPQALDEVHAIQSDAVVDDDVRRDAYLLEAELRQRVSHGHVRDRHIGRGKIRHVKQRRQRQYQRCHHARLQQIGAAPAHFTHHELRNRRGNSTTKSIG